MPVGPGRYDDLCTHVRKEAQAELAIVIIGQGNKGSGFSIQTDDPFVVLKLPQMLRAVADQIEATGLEGRN